MKNVGKVAVARGHNQGQRVPKIFRAPIYGAHCVVICSIAQLLVLFCCRVCAVAAGGPAQQALSIQVHAYSGQPLRLTTRSAGRPNLAQSQAVAGMPGYLLNVPCSRPTLFSHLA